MVESVRIDGILQPLLVRPKGDGYELVAGERRYRAAQAVGLSEVPVTVREMSDTEARQFALTENLQREDLNPVEETEGILALLEVRLERSREEVIALLNQMARANRGLTDNVVRNEDVEAVNGVFGSVGRLTPESFRTHRLPLLNLPGDVLDALREGKIEYTKAKAIAQVTDDEARVGLLTEAIEQGLSLTQIRERVKALKAPVTEEAPEAEDIQKRVAKLGRLSKRSETLDDPQTRQKVDKLLAQLEKLLAPK
jgi:ParB family chromosome partitioning protein